MDLLSTGSQSTVLNLVLGLPKDEGEEDMYILKASGSPQNPRKEHRPRSQDGEAAGDVLRQG